MSLCSCDQQTHEGLLVDCRLITIWATWSYSRFMSARWLIASASGALSQSNPLFPADALATAGGLLGCNTSSGVSGVGWLSVSACGARFAAFLASFSSFLRFVSALVAAALAQRSGVQITRLAGCTLSCSPSASPARSTSVSCPLCSAMLPSP